MRILNHILCLGTFASLFSACLPTKMDGVGGKSGGSELRATLPEPKLYSENPEIAKKITHYALKIDATNPSETCKSLPPKTVSYDSQTNLKETVQMDCDYSIALAIGTAINDQMTNFYEGKVSLTKDKIQPNSTNVTLAVYLTEAGKAAGFNSGEVKTPPIGGNSTDLSIDVKIGNGTGSTATPNANGGNSGANSTGSKLTADQILQKMIEIQSEGKLKFISKCSDKSQLDLNCIMINPNINVELITRNIKIDNAGSRNIYSYLLDKKYTLTFQLMHMPTTNLIDNIQNNKATLLKLKDLKHFEGDQTNTVVGTYSPN